LELSVKSVASRSVDVAWISNLLPSTLQKPRFYLRKTSRCPIHGLVRLQALPNVVKHSTMKADRDVVVKLHGIFARDSGKQTTLTTGKEPPITIISEAQWVPKPLWIW
jgi:hypothetical protein